MIFTLVSTTNLSLNSFSQSCSLFLILLKRAHNFRVCNVTTKLRHFPMNVPFSFGKIIYMCFKCCKLFNQKSTAREMINFFLNGMWLFVWQHQVVIISSVNLRKFVNRIIEEIKMKLIKVFDSQFAREHWTQFIYSLQHLFQEDAREELN